MKKIFLFALMMLAMAGFTMAQKHAPKGHHGHHKVHHHHHPSHHSTHR